MKAKTKISVGVFLVMCASLLGYICARIFHFDFSLAVLLSTILAMIGLFLSGADEMGELVPERRYKIINFSVTDTGEYTTLEYKNIYCKTIIHTFKNVNFEKRGTAGGFVVGYEPNVGRFVTACKEEGSDELVLKHI